MAKRSRGTRPGQRRPTQRTAKPASARPVSASPATVTAAAVGLTAAEEARAAELEAQIVAQDTGVDASAQQRRRAGRGDRPVRTTAGLAAAAANEYAYVSRDLRRFLLLAALLFVALFVIWGVALVTGIISF